MTLTGTNLSNMAKQGSSRSAGLSQIYTPCEFTDGRVPSRSDATSLTESPAGTRQLVQLPGTLTAGTLLLHQAVHTG